MPAYSFEAIDAQGQTRKGVLEADTARAARGMLRRGVRRWRICPRGNNVFDAAAGGTTGKQRRENQNCNDAHEDETPHLDAHPNAEKLGPVPACSRQIAGRKFLSYS